jgi:excinuclease ABC subunit C
VALIKEEIISPQYISGSNRLSLSALSSLRRAHTYDSHQTYTGAQFRIEGYDIAHMAGQNMVGVMTVVEDRELVRSEYKKFIIRTQNKSNDTGALEEVLSRRLRHTEWGLPHLIVVDGSTAQINIAKAVLSRYQFKIPVVSVVKDDKHKAKAIMGDEGIIKKYKKEILLINNESHRFAITFHKKRRDKNFLI